MIITQLQMAPNENIFHHYSNDDSICSYKKQRLITYLESKYSKIDLSSEYLKVYDWDWNERNDETAIIEFYL